MGKETKAKQDKMTEIKKLNTQIMHIKSKNLKTAEALEDCNRYALFLENITPKEYREEQLRLKAERRSERQGARRQKRREWWHQKCATERAEMKAKVEAELASSNAGQRRRRKNTAVEPEEVKDPPTPGTPEEEKGNSSSGEDIPMYFKEPSQLIGIFATLGESNLFLIQNCNQTQEALEDRDKSRDDKKEKDKKKKDKDKKKDQEDDADKNERQAQHMEVLNSKVTEVYEMCIGKNESNIDAIPMLTQIEKQLEKLLETIGGMERIRCTGGKQTRQGATRLATRTTAYRKGEGADAEDGRTTEASSAASQEEDRQAFDDPSHARQEEEAR